MTSTQDDQKTFQPPVDATQHFPYGKIKVPPSQDLTSYVKLDLMMQFPRQQMMA